MKQVRYLIGAVGLAPAALGTALVPAVAHAATTPHTIAGNVKTVSLHHVMGNRAEANATASASSSSSSGAAQSPDTGGGCGGNTTFTIPRHDDIKGNGWYRNGPMDSYTCIGTVDVRLWFNKTFCKTADLAISSALGPNGKGGSDGFSGSKKVCGTAGHWKVASFAVQDILSHFPGVGEWVCASSTYGAQTCREIGS